MEGGNPERTWGEERKLLPRSEFRERWPFLAILFFIQVFAFGFPTFALPFIYSGATEEFGWSRQQAVLLASFKFYTSAAGALFVGRLIDYVNPKWVIIASAILGALAMLSFLAADNLPVYYTLGLILGLSASGLAISINITVVRSFEKSAGTMLGIVLTGTSVAGVLLPLAVAPLMECLGWRQAMAVLSCTIWIAALLALSRLPSERAQAATTARPKLWPHFTRLVGTRDFWIVFVGAGVVAAIDQSMIQNQVLFLKSEKGLSLDAVKWGAALLAGTGIGAKTVFGWIFDKLSMAGIALCYLLLAVSIGLSFTVAGIATMLVFVALLGIAHAGVIVSGPILLKQRYGTENLGMNLGIFTLCTSIGFGSGPPMMASLADKSGSYAGAFSLGIAAVLFVAILVYFLRPDRGRSR